jgi:copper chaperone CopZ
MRGDNCVVAVERHLKEVPGIVAVSVQSPPGLAAITFQAEIDVSELKDALDRMAIR